MAAVGALQDQVLMAQGKDLSLQSFPKSEADWQGDKEGEEEGKHSAGSLPTAALQIQRFQ
jgi:hypothetical protein